MEAPHIEAPFTENGNHPVFVSLETQKRYPIITAEIALQQRPPLAWTVAGLFQPSSLGMIVGNFGIGKTYAALDMAVSVARGETWLGRQTTAGPVLVIDEESGERRLSDRLAMVLRGHEAGGDTPVYAYSFANFSLLDDLGIREMLAAIQHIGPKLIVIDALMDLIPGADENKVQEVLPALKIMREIAEVTNSCALMLHHTNKIGEYRGSSAIAGKVDVLLKMEREAESNTAKFSFTKARDVEANDFTATMNFMGDRFWLSEGGTVADKGPRLSRAHQYVLDYLKSHADASMEDITSHADSCSENSARQAVYGLCKLKLIRRTDGGGNGVKATYDLSKINARQVDVS